MAVITTYHVSPCSGHCPADIEIGGFIPHGSSARILGLEAQ